MQTASFVGFVKTVLIILLIYFAFKIVFRLYGQQILRYLLKKAGQRVTKNYQQQQQDFQSNRQQQQKGKVSIDKNPSQAKKQSNNDVGEYIEYEEID